MVRLSDVLLEQVTAQEFARLNEFWYGKPLDGDFNPVRILRPLTFGSYRTLVLEFLDFQYSDKICVYNNKWAHYIVKRMNKKDVQKVCKTAKLDKVKRGHLEVHLNGGIMYPTVLRFSEQNDTIVNYLLLYMADNSVGENLHKIQISTAADCGFRPGKLVYQYEIFCNLPYRGMCACLLSPICCARLYQRFSS